jgi:hypothetical protein
VRFRVRWEGGGGGWDGRRVGRLWVRRSRYRRLGRRVFLVSLRRRGRWGWWWNFGFCHLIRFRHWRIRFGRLGFGIISFSILCWCGRVLEIECVFGSWGVICRGVDFTRIRWWVDHLLRRMCYDRGGCPPFFKLFVLSVSRLSFIGIRSWSLWSFSSEVWRIWRVFLQSVRELHRLYRCQHRRVHRIPAIWYLLNRVKWDTWCGGSLAEIAGFVGGGGGWVGGWLFEVTSWLTFFICGFLGFVETIGLLLFAFDHGLEGFCGGGLEFDFVFWGFYGDAAGF